MKVDQVDRTRKWSQKGSFSAKQLKSLENATQGKLVDPTSDALTPEAPKDEHPEVTELKNLALAFEIS